MEQRPQNIQDYELIRRFFDFDLTDQELAMVQERMETDTAFLERMHIYHEMNEHIDKVNIKRSSELQENSIPQRDTSPKISKEESNAQVNRRILRIVLRVAAAIGILAIGFLFLFQFFTKQPKPSILADTYWQESTKVTFSNLRSDENISESEELLIAASESFIANDFQTALDQLNQIKAVDSLYHKAALLKGEILFEQMQYTAAIQQFQVVIDDSTSEHNDIAHWYQALAYIKLNEIEQAKAELEYIIEQQYPLQNSAAELLEKL